MVGKKEQESEDLLLEARNFVDSYKKEIGESIKEGKSVIFIDFKEMASFSHELSEAIVETPGDNIQILESAVEESGLVENPTVRLKNLPETYTKKIRNLRANHLNNLIQVEGIIRQASEVRPQVVNAKFECPSCGTVISVLQVKKKFKKPNRCSCGRRGNFKLLNKDMVDAQRLVIEESPEALIGGEQPRRVNAFLKKDLTEPKMEKKTTPGSKIKLVGVLKEIPITSRTGKKLTRSDIALEANNVIPLEETFEELNIKDEDKRQIKELAADPNILDKFIDSVTPSVYGYKEIKKALTLQMFGGVKKARSDGTSTRGDIHILLVGDPGVAKSVSLKYVSKVAPKGRYLSGKSATGAGITATVVRDEYLKGWSLEAGAMVLSNKGVVCIDELEKMGEEDRSTMHEALEQQTVTISKANVQATLQAQTSVLAAANPKFGRFDRYKTVANQIDLPSTLINRFDVIFILKDNPDKAKDKAIANHVLKEHQADKDNDPVIDKELMRKYIAYARQSVFPEITNEARNKIKDFYVNLRNSPSSSDDPNSSVPISARQLEGLIRLSEAHARVRLSEKVEEKDAKVAIDLMKYYLMQVGYDYETKSFDIDRVATGVSTSERGRIRKVKDAISKLESRLGKLIPIEELKEELEGELEEDQIDESLQKLSMSGDIFHPKKGHIQKM